MFVTNAERRRWLSFELRRRQIKLTQTDVARVMNISCQQIQKYEKGVNSINTFRLEPLRLALKIPEHKVGFLINKYNRKEREDENKEGNRAS